MVSIIIVIINICMVAILVGTGTGSGRTGVVGRMVISSSPLPL